MSWFLTPKSHHPFPRSSPAKNCLELASSPGLAQVPLLSKPAATNPDTEDFFPRSGVSLPPLVPPLASGLAPLKCRSVKLHHWPVVTPKCHSIVQCDGPIAINVMLVYISIYKFLNQSFVASVVNQFLTALYAKPGHFGYCSLVIFNFCP